MRGEYIKFISLSFSIVSFQKLYFELLIARFMRCDFAKAYWLYYLYKQPFQPFHDDGE